MATGKDDELEAKENCSALRGGDRPLQDEVGRIS